MQGALAGAAFAVAGLHGAVFWGSVMTVLSIIPGVGAAIVWVPASVYLIVAGHVGAGILLAAFCAAVVGTVDNFLRPRLVGRDIKMHDLLILFSTLGGILLFGVVGFIIGPILAALFVTIWEIYGVVFRDDLPEVAAAAQGEGQDDT
jgi:predicted PurR-regulated permease PerM